MKSMKMQLFRNDVLLCGGKGSSVSTMLLLSINFCSGYQIWGLQVSNMLGSSTIKFTSCPVSSVQCPTTFAVQMRLSMEDNNPSRQGVF
jgi:hypothetical protein